MPPTLVTMATHWAETTCVPARMSVMGRGQEVIHPASVSTSLQLWSGLGREFMPVVREHCWNKGDRFTNS